MMLLWIYGCMSPSYPEGWAKGSLSQSEHLNSSSGDSTHIDTESGAEGSIEGAWYGEFYGANNIWEGFIEYVAFTESEEVACFFVLEIIEAQPLSDCAYCDKAFSFFPSLIVEEDSNCSVSPEIYEEQWFSIGYAEEKAYWKQDSQWQEAGVAQWDGEEGVLEVIITPYE